MFNIGPLELMVILVVALLVVGPKRLPDVARAIGRGLQEFRKAQSEVQETLRGSFEEPVASKPALGDTAETGGPDAAPSSEASETVEAARTLGRGLAEIRRAREEIQNTFRIDLSEPPPKPAASAPPAGTEEPHTADDDPLAGSS